MGAPGMGFQGLRLAAVTVLALLAGSSTCTSELELAEAYFTRDCILAEASALRLRCTNEFASSILTGCLAASDNGTSEVKVLLGPLPDVAAIFSQLPAPPGSPPATWHVQNRTQWDAALLSEARSRQSSYDAFMVDPAYLTDLVASSSLLDLGPYISTDSWDGSWQGSLSVLRRWHSAAGESVYMLPMGAASYVLHYRADVLEAFGLAVPRTWDQLLYAAQLINGTSEAVDRDADDEGADGESLYGLCTLSFPTCHADAFELMAVWASFVQVRGAREGAFFDPTTFTPLVNNAGMEAAMRYYRALAALGPPPAAVATITNASTCNSVMGTAARLYQAGRCAFQIAPHPLFKEHALLAPSMAVRRHSRITQLPGAPLVLDRPTGALVPCTQTVCPYGGAVPAWPSDASTRAAVLGNLTLGHNTSIANAASAGRGMVFANFAPVLGLAPLGLAVNADRAARQRAHAVRWLRAMTDPETIWRLVVTPSSPIAPFRYEHFSPSFLGRWLAVGGDGYDPEALRGYLELSWELLNHPNLLGLPTRLQRMNNYRAALHHAAFAVTSTSQSLAHIMEGLDSTLAVYFGPKAAGYATLRLEYLMSLERADLLAAPSPPPPPSTQHTHVRGKRPDGTASRGIGHTVGAAVGSVALAALMAALAFGYRRLTSHHGWGRSKAPLVGPGTTLVVTDIESSTMLWEEIDALTMDVALNLHHDTLRRIIAQWEGYESVTEGDSFTVAFHTADAAMGFSLQVQSELMQQPWPSEVLAHSACKPVYLVTCKRLRHLQTRAAAAAVTSKELARGSVLAGEEELRPDPRAATDIYVPHSQRSRGSRRIASLSNLSLRVRHSLSFMHRVPSALSPAAVGGGASHVSHLTVALAGASASVYGSAALSQANAVGSTPRSTMTRDNEITEEHVEEECDLYGLHGEGLRLADEHARLAHVQSLDRQPLRPPTVPAWGCGGGSGSAGTSRRQGIGVEPAEARLHATGGGFVRGPTATPGLVGGSSGNLPVPDSMSCRQSLSIDLLTAPQPSSIRPPNFAGGLSRSGFNSMSGNETLFLEDGGAPPSTPAESGALPVLLAALAARGSSVAGPEPRHHRARGMSLMDTAVLEEAAASLPPPPQELLLPLRRTRSTSATPGAGPAPSHSSSRDGGAVGSTNNALASVLGGRVTAPSMQPRSRSAMMDTGGSAHHAHRGRCSMSLQSGGGTEGGAAAPASKDDRPGFLRRVQLSLRLAGGGGGSASSHSANPRSPHWHEAEGNADLGHEVGAPDARSTPAHGRAASRGNSGRRAGGAGFARQMAAAGESIAGGGEDDGDSPSSASMQSYTSTASHGTTIQSLLLLQPSRQRHKGRARQDVWASPATYGSEFGAKWAELPEGLVANPAAVGGVLVFCGFRVRIGMHSGVKESVEINRQHPSGRTRYSGPILLCAKAVSDAAHGGMVFATRQAVQQCSQQYLATQVVLWRLGDLILGNPRLPSTVFQLSSTALALRAVLHRPLSRTHMQLSRGLFDAPLSVVGVAVIKLAASSLLTGHADAAVSLEASSVFQALAYQHARHQGGYLTNLGVGTATAVFPNAYQAALCAALVHADMYRHRWSESLLSASECESLHAVNDEGIAITMMRGPRVKAVVHWGAVCTMLHPLSGVLCYEGPALDHAMRSLQALTSNVVVVTREAASALQRYWPPGCPLPGSGSRRMSQIGRTASGAAYGGSGRLTEAGLAAAAAAAAADGGGGSGGSGSASARSSGPALVAHRAMPAVLARRGRGSTDGASTGGEGKGSGGGGGLGVLRRPPLATRSTSRRSMLSLASPLYVGVSATGSAHQPLIAIAAATAASAATSGNRRRDGGAATTAPPQPHQHVSPVSNSPGVASSANTSGTDDERARGSLNVAMSSGGAVVSGPGGTESPFLTGGSRHKSWNVQHAAAASSGRPLSSGSGQHLTPYMLVGTGSGGVHVARDSTSMLVLTMSSHQLSVPHGLSSSVAPSGAGGGVGRQPSPGSDARRLFGLVHADTTTAGDSTATGRGQSQEASQASAHMDSASYPQLAPPGQGSPELSLHPERRAARDTEQPANGASPKCGRDLEAETRSAVHAAATYRFNPTAVVGGRPPMGTRAAAALEGTEEPTVRLPADHRRGKLPGPSVPGTWGSTAGHAAGDQGSAAPSPGGDRRPLSQRSPSHSPGTSRTAAGTAASPAGSSGPQVASPLPLEVQSAESPSVSPPMQAICEGQPSLPSRALTHQQLQQQRQLRVMQSARDRSGHGSGGTLAANRGGIGAEEESALITMQKQATLRGNASFTYGQQSAMQRPRLQDLLAVSPYVTPASPIGRPAAAELEPIPSGDSNVVSEITAAGGSVPGPDSGSRQEHLATGAGSLFATRRSPAAPRAAARDAACGSTEAEGTAARGTAASTWSLAAPQRNALSAGATNAGVGGASPKGGSQGVRGGVGGACAQLSVEALIRGQAVGRMARSFTFTTHRPSPLAFSSYAGDPQGGLSRRPSQTPRNPTSGMAHVSYGLNPAASPEADDSTVQTSDATGLASQPVTAARAGRHGSTVPAAPTAAQPHAPRRGSTVLSGASIAAAAHVARAAGVSGVSGINTNTSPAVSSTLNAVGYECVRDSNSTGLGSRPSQHASTARNSDARSSQRSGATGPCAASAFTRVRSHGSTHSGSVLVDGDSNAVVDKRNGRGAQLSGFLNRIRSLGKTNTRVASNSSISLDAPAPTGTFTPSLSMPLPKPRSARRNSYELPDGVHAPSSDYGSPCSTVMLPGAGAAAAASLNSGSGAMRPFKGGMGMDKMPTLPEAGVAPELREFSHLRLKLMPTRLHVRGRGRSSRSVEGAATVAGATGAATGSDVTLLSGGLRGDEQLLVYRAILIDGGVQTRGYGTGLGAQEHGSGGIPSSQGLDPAAPGAGATAAATSAGSRAIAAAAPGRAAPGTGAVRSLHQEAAAEASDLVQQFLSGFADLADPSLASAPWVTSPDRALLEDRALRDVLELRAKLAAQEAQAQLFERDAFLF